MDREILQASFLDKHNCKDNMFIKLQTSTKCQMNLKCEDIKNRKGEERLLKEEKSN